jgi:hypothetical protein
MTSCGTTTSKGCCGRPQPPEQPNLRQIVDHYIRHHRPRGRAESGRFRQQPSLDDAVRLAAGCIDQYGKRHSHQRRIPRASLDRLARRLAAVDLMQAGTFQELYEMVRAAGESIHMIGPLTTYDVATRIGAYLHLAPNRVYLHAGTRAGARALGIAGRNKTVQRSELPREFGRLTAAECEDVLCIYKDVLAAAIRRRPRPVARASDRE